MINITITTAKAKFIIVANNRTKTINTSTAKTIESVFKNLLPTESKLLQFTSKSITVPSRFKITISESTNDFGIPVNNFNFCF